MELSIYSSKGKLIENAVFYLFTTVILLSNMPFFM